MYLSSWVTSEDGTEVFLFDDEGRHLETRDAQTHALIYSFGYDADGLLSTVTDAFGDMTTLQRSNGQITGILGPDNHLTAIALDGNGYLQTVTDPSNASFTVQHDASGLLVGLDDSDSEHDFSYDSRGRLDVDQQVIAYQPPSGPLEQETVAQDLETLPSEQPSEGVVLFTTAEGRETTYAYARTGSEYDRSVTFPDGSVTSSVSTPERDVVTYADGTVVTTDWDVDPRLGANTRAPASIRVDIPGDPGETGDDLTKIITFDRSFDPRCSVFTEEGRHLASGADVPATIVTTAPTGRTTTTTLNADGQVGSIQVGTLAPVVYAYDARGRVSAVTQTDGVQPRSVTFGYHATEGWLEAVTDSQNRTTTFQRDAVGRMLAQIAPTSAQLVSFTYDEDGNVTSVTPPSRPAHLFHHDSADRLREYTPPAVAGVSNPETTTDYTPDHQADLTMLPQGASIDYDYDVVTGKLLTATTPESTYTFDYFTEGEGDPADLGLVESVNIVAGADNLTLGYAYDGDIPTEEVMTGTVSGTVGWAFDDQLRLTTETVEGDAVSYGYHPSQGLLTNIGAMTATYDPSTAQLDTTTLGNVVTTYAYDDFGDLAGILYEASNSPVYEVAYTRDVYGRIETKTETLDGTVRVRCYEYDSLDRLENVYDAADSNGCTGSLLETYGYDANGNRASATNSAGTIGSGSIVVDDQDRLLTYGGTSYTYNADGYMATRTTAAGTWTYSYDAVGNLREVDPPGVDDTITYVVDPRNRRVGKRDHTGALVQGFLYGDDLSIVAELDGAGQVVSRFVYGTHANVPEYMVRGGVTYRFLTDQNGSVVGVVNTDTGSLVQTREYDAYGRIVDEWTDPTVPVFSQPFGFAGGLYDADTGLVRFGARDYRPEAGSWAAKDPARFDAGDASLYSYCFSEPVNFVDQTGLAPVDGGWGHASNFAAGFGDTLSFGATRWIRESLEASSGVVDVCSGVYTAGEYTGVVYSTLLGAAGGWRAAGQRMAGKEFSHWIPNRALRRTGNRWLRDVFGRSRWNGNYVSPLRHSRHDPFRYLRGQTKADKWHPVARFIDRIPNVYKGILAGELWGWGGRYWNRR